MINEMPLVRFEPPSLMMTHWSTEPVCLGYLDQLALFRKLARIFLSYFILTIQNESCYTDQIFVAGEHDEGLVDESVDVTQVLDGHVAFPLGLKKWVRG